MAYSEYAMENINIEESKILVQDKWYALNELKNTIKDKVSNDNFDVIQLASAIQELQEALDNISQLKLTLHVELMESFKELATNSGSTFENVLRDALITRIDFGLTKNMSKIPGKPKGIPEKKNEKKSTIKIKKHGYKPKKVACRKCKSVIVVDSPKRPITVTCPECGTKGKLSK
jgi:hypothetical protein